MREVFPFIYPSAVKKLSSGQAFQSHCLLHPLKVTETEDTLLDAADDIQIYV